MTKTEQITAAIADRLTAAGLAVRTDTDGVYSFEDMPAIVVDVGNESPQPALSTGFIYWDLQVSLWIIAMSGTPKLAPEPTRLAAHAALYADRSLGGRVQPEKAKQPKQGADQ